MTTKFFSIIFAICLLIFAGVYGFCVFALDSKKEDYSGKQIISSSTNNTVLEVLSAETLAELDSLDLQTLSLFKSCAHLRNYSVIKEAIAEAELAGAEKIVPLENAFSTYQKLYNKFTHISTNDLCSYLAAEMDELTSDIYTPVTSWETDKLMRFRRAQKLFHFVDYNDSNLLAMIPHFEKHLTTNGSLYLAIGGLFKTTTNGYPHLIKALDNESIGIQSSILQTIANNFILNKLDKNSVLVLLKKSRQYLKNPPTNPFPAEDPHWLQTEAWIQGARCAAFRILFLYYEDSVDASNLLIETALHEANPIIRGEALKEMRGCIAQYELSSSEERKKFIMPPEDAVNMIISNPQDPPLIRYMAQLVLFWKLHDRMLIQTNPMKTGNIYYQFPDEKIFIPLY